MESVGVRVEMSTLNPTVSLSDALDSAAQRGLLYCIIITTQHELHRSVTLTILHGRNPQGKLVLVREPRILSNYSCIIILVSKLTIGSLVFVL